MKRIASGVLALAFLVAFTPNLFAAAQVINGADVAYGATGTPSSATAGGLDFQTDNTLTTAADANNVGATGGVSVSVTGDGVGTLTTAHTITVSGTIGTAAGNDLKVLNAGAAGKTVTLSGNAFIATTNLTGTGTLALSGNLTGALNYNNGATGTVTLAAGKTLTGAVTNATTNQGNLTLGSGSTVTGAVGSTGVGLNTITVSGGNAAIGGNTLASNFALGGNTLAITGTLGVPATGTIATTVNSDTSFGRITTTGNSTVTAGTTVAVTVGGYVSNGASMVVVNDATGAGNNVAGGLTVTSSSPNVTFTANSAAADDLTLTATRNNIATTANTTTIATVVNSFSSPSGDITTVLGALDSLTSSASVEEALAQLDPADEGATTQASFNVVNEAVGAVTGHLGETAGTGPGSGVSTGDFWTDNGIWVKGFGNRTEQDNHKGATGYDADLWGLIGGIDGLVSPNWRLGLAGGYAWTGVSGKLSAGDTDIDSVLGTVYLRYDDPSPWYGDMGFTLTWNGYEGSRPIRFGTIDRIASSDYDGLEYTGFADVGYVIAQKGWNVTPMAGFTYSYLDVDGYTETQAGSLNLVVDPQSYDQAQLSLGVQVDTTVDTNSGKWVPEVHFKWLYDFVGDQVSTTAAFTGGGAAFTTNGLDPEQSVFNVGAGVTFYTKGSVSVTGTYDLHVASDYVSHTGMGVVRYEF